jgi:glyoxylase-like metal-dependent hydrolase (beta-lactamase superfamily II)
MLSKFLRRKGNAGATIIGTIVLCVGVSVAAIAGAAEQQGNRKYNYMPAGGYASTTSAKYVKASPTRVLQPDEKVEGLFDAAMNGQTLVQRLTERSYWVFVENYSTTFYVGDKGVLLLDPLGETAAPKVLEAIKSVTDKPLVAVVYSHNHVDHIGGIKVLLDDAKKNGREIEIIASTATAKKQAYLKSSLPAATKVLSFPKDSMKFENLTLSVAGFERAAHTDDSAMWLLQEEGIVHIPDHVNADQMPYLGFGGSENYVYFRGNLQAIADADWKIFSGGHGNVGTKKDTAFMLTYLDDLERATKDASANLDWNALSAAGPNNHEALMHSASEALGRTVKDALRPKYGEFYGFEASVPYQAQMVWDALESYK